MKLYDSNVYLVVPLDTSYSDLTIFQGHSSIGYVRPKVVHHVHQIYSVLSKFYVIVILLTQARSYIQSCLIQGR